MTLHPGDPVTVTFDGAQHSGVVERIDRGFVHCRIVIDPEMDYGSVTARLAPHSTVCVRPSEIRKADA